MSELCHTDIWFKTEDEKRLFKQYLKSQKEKTGERYGVIAMKAIQHYYSLFDDKGNLK